MGALLEKGNNFDFLGRHHDDLISCNIADGKICPVQLKPFNEIPIE